MKKEKKKLTSRQKKFIGISVICALLIIGGISTIIALNKEKLFSVETGVADSSLGGDAKQLTVGEDGVEITSGGIYTLSDDITNGSVIIRADKADVELILENVSITNSDGPAIYIESADNVYITLKGENKISATVSSEYNGAIHSKSDLLLRGDGSLELNSNLDGVVSKDDLQIDGGTYKITTEDDGIIGKDSLKVTAGDFTISAGGDGIKTTNETEKGDAEIAGGTFNITAGSDGLQVIANLLISGGDLKINSKDDGVHADGDIVISGSNIEVSSGDDGFHADSNLTINDGAINITKSYEGIEGSAITINGGDIKIVSSDDGINAGGGSDTLSASGSRDAFSGDISKVLTINGGTIYINASGDGLDSNGNLYIAGGTIYVDGPTNDGNGAIDYGDNGCEFTITGGTLVAVGSSGMAVNATSATQPSVIINLSSSYTGELNFGDVSYTPSKSYNSVVISSPSLKIGNSYNLTIGGQSVQTINISNNITSSGTMGTQPGMGQRQQGGMGRR